jgi:hypothetical protein
MVLASLARGSQTSDIAGSTPADLLPLVRAVVRTFAATNGSPVALLPLTRGAVASLVVLLLELAVAPPDTGRAEGRVAELQAIERALS